MSSFANKFAAGMRIADDLMNTYDTASMGAAMKEAKDARPETTQEFSTEDAGKIDSAAQGGQEVTWGEQVGGYLAQPKAQDGGGPPQVFQPQEHTSFLGNKTAGKLSDEQIAQARTGHLESRAASLFNPARGLKMVADLKAGERDDFKFGLIKTEANRLTTERAKEDKATEEEKKAWIASPYGQAMDKFGKELQSWQAQSQERAAAAAAGTPMEGPDPVQPQMPAVSQANILLSHLQSTQARMAAGGKVDMVALAAAGQTLKKAQDEGVTSALRAAQDGATIEQIAKMFEGQGAMRFDPASVTSDTTVQRADGMTSRVIQYTNPVTGKSETIDTMADLSALGKAGEYYKRAVDGLDARGKAALRQSQINYNNARAGLATSKSGGAAIPAAIPAGGATGATVAPDTAQSPSLADATVAHIAQLNSSAPAASKFTPQYSAAVNNVAINLAQLNPGGNVRDLAELSMQIQDGTPLPSEIHFDAATGSPVRATPSARSPGSYTVLGRAPDVSALSKDERGQLDSSLGNQVAKLGLSPNQLRMAAKSPEQTASLRAMLIDQGKAALQAQIDKAKKETGRDTPAAQIEAAHKAGQQRIDALLRLSAQMYGAR